MLVKLSFKLNLGQKLKKTKNHQGKSIFVEQTVEKKTQGVCLSQAFYIKFGEKKNPTKVSQAVLKFNLGQQLKKKQNRG